MLPELEEALKVVMEYGSVRAAARETGIPKSTLQDRYKAAKNQDKRHDIELYQPPSEIDISELIQRRIQEFERRKAHEEHCKLIPVKVRIDGPIGLLHFGDPHVDDSGTDFKQLLAHAALVRDNPAVYGCNVGDTTNNWIGRLAALYANQTTKASEAWALAEYWIQEVRDWLYMIAGNHDAWSGAGDPLTWISRQNGIHYASSQVRMGLQFPNGREVRINARHDFPGTSQWNAAHGPAKAARMGFRDHINIAGHTHTSGYNVLKDPESGTIMHAIRVASYKLYDDYAKTKGFPDHTISPCVFTVIDPTASDVGLVKVFFEPEEGVDFLRYLRAKKAA